MSQAGSLFGSAAVLDAKWRLGSGTIDPSAGIAAPKADLAGKRSDFAQTLRERKSKAVESEPTPKGSVDRDRPAHAEKKRPEPKKSGRAEETPQVEDHAAHETDRADTRETEAESSQAQPAKDPVDAAGDVEDKDVSGEVVPIDQAIESVIVPISGDPELAAVATVQAQVATDADGAEASAPLPSGDAEPASRQSQNSEVKPAAQVVGSVSQNATTTDAETIDPAQAKQAAGELAASPKAEVEEVGATQASVDVAPKAVEPHRSNGTKAHVRERRALEAHSEDVTPASESGVRARESEAAPERVAADAQVQADEVPPPTRRTGNPAQEPPVATARVEVSASVRGAAESASTARVVPEAAATSVARVEGAPATQQSTSADMLRALAPAHSPPSSSQSPQQVQTPGAANQDYQRLLGQQVERGIAQAIQQATAATDAMVMGTGAVVLRLHPANLGQLKVQIRFEGSTGGVRARFEASSSRAKGLLGGSIDALKTALEGRGLRVDEVVVAQSPRLPEPELGAFSSELAQDGRTSPNDFGAGFADGKEQAAPLNFGAPAGGVPRESSAEPGNDIPIGGLGERPVWLTGAAGWTVDADGNVRVDALV